MSQDTMPTISSVLRQKIKQRMVEISHQHSTGMTGMGEESADVFVTREGKIGIGFDTFPSASGYAGVAQTVAVIAAAGFIAGGSKPGTKAHITDQRATFETMGDLIEALNALAIDPKQKLSSDLSTYPTHVERLSASRDRSLDYLSFDNF